MNTETQDAAIRRRALERALLACYELIDRFRRELAALDAGSKRAG